MQLKTGQTLVSTVDGTSFVVVRSPGADTVVTCGGAPMVDRADAPATAPAAPAASGSDAGALLGKRYTADGSDIELLCVKPGTQPVAVDGVPVAQKTAKPLPASD